jgi:hypothetical protein
MDVIGSHAARLPAIDGRWEPGPWERDELLRALVDGGMAGPRVSHPMDNVRDNIRLLCEGDEDKQFGMTGLQTHTPEQVFSLVAAAAGFPDDPRARTGPVPVDARLVLRGLDGYGDRLALAAERGESIVIATGHPVGLAHFYMELAKLLVAGGARLLQPCDRASWKKRDGRRREIRYLEGVAVLTDRTSARHTHSGEPMRRILEEVRPDLVIADHGWAGAAVEGGVDVVAIADVNDPALILARAQDRLEHVVVMDDNVRPEDYWPCFQAVVARFPA